MKNLKAFGALALLLASSAASAATATGSFAVSATVLNVCTVTALPLTFGNYDPTSSSNTDATTTITVLCTLGNPYTVALDKGTNGTAVTARQMLISGGGTTKLNYALSRDASHTLNWGQTVGTDTASGTGTGLAQSLTVYGRITASQAVSAGIYADTVNVTVNY